MPPARGLALGREPSARKTIARAALHFLLCLALLWQGAAGAIAASRMAAREGVFVGAICRPLAGHMSPDDPATALERELCAVHCGAVVAASPPTPPQLATPAFYRPLAYDPPRLVAARTDHPAPLPPARGPPVLS